MLQCHINKYYISRNHEYLLTIYKGPNMFISIKRKVTSLLRNFDRPQNYGSALEYYIVANNPKDTIDVERLTQEFDRRHKSPCRDHMWNV
jgi:hypothetical protein